MSVPTIRAEYVGNNPPLEEGNYLVVNLLTIDQFGVRVHHHPDDPQLRVYSNLDCMCHEPTDFADPAYRWYKLSTLDKAQCVKLAEVSP